MDFHGLQPPSPLMSWPHACICGLPPTGGPGPTPAFMFPPTTGGPGPTPVLWNHIAHCLGCRCSAGNDGNYRETPQHAKTEPYLITTHSSTCGGCVSLVIKHSHRSCIQTTHHNHCTHHHKTVVPRKIRICIFWLVHTQAKTRKKFRRCLNVRKLYREGEPY